MAGDRKIVASFELEVDDAKRNAEAVARAFDQMGQSGSSQAQAITRQLDFTQAALDRVVRKTNEGRAITQSDLAAIVQNWNRAADAVEQYEKNVGKVPAEVSAAMDSQRAALARATAEVGRATDAVNDNAAAAKIAGDNWPGLGAAVEATGGKFGTAAAKVGLVTAAFGEGWQAGMKLNQLFGTDTKLWEEAIERWGQKVGIIVKSAADVAVEGGLTIVAALTPGEGWQERVSKAYGFLKQSVEDYVTKVGDLEGALKREENARVAAANAAAAQAAHTAATAEEQKKAKQAAEELAEQKRKLAEKINDVVRSLKEENDELAKQQDSLLDAEHGLVDQSAQLDSYGRALETIRGQLAAQRDEVERLTARYGEHSPMVAHAREQQTVLEQALASAEMRYNTTALEVDRYEDAQKRAQSAIEKSKESITKLTDEQAKLEGRTTATTTATAAAGSATKTTADAMWAAATAAAGQGAGFDSTKSKVDAATESQQKLEKATAGANIETQHNAAALAASAASAERAATSVAQMSAALPAPARVEATAAAFERLASALNRVTENGGPAVRILDDLRKSAADAAGDENGG